MNSPKLITLSRHI